MNTAEILRRRRLALTKPVLKRADIEALEGCKHSQASKIMADCRGKFGGSIPLRVNCITTKSYFIYCGYKEDEWKGLVAGLLKGED